MNQISLEAKIEGYLFWKGEPVDKKDLAQVFSVSKSAVDEACIQLHANLLQRGVKLLETEDQVEIRTHEDLEKLITEANKETLSKELSKPALETLAIVLYRNSVTRADIDYIRGVNSTFILRMLAIRGLVEKYTDPLDSRKVLYKPSMDLLSYIGVENTSMLPSYETFNAILLSKGVPEVTPAKTENEDPE